VNTDLASSKSLAIVDANVAASPIDPASATNAASSLIARP
jgi:hypothetical protein